MTAERILIAGMFFFRSFFSCKLSSIAKTLVFMQEGSQSCHAINLPNQNCKRVLRCKSESENRRAIVNEKSFAYFLLIQ